MNTRNTLGLPENCMGCSTPSCKEQLSTLVGLVQVNQVGDKLQAYPKEPFFDRECREVVLQLAICMTRASVTETPAETL